MRMEITLNERVMLANQYRMLEKLYPGEEKKYAKYVTILENGYTEQYSELVDSFCKEFPIEDCAEVSEIFLMFRMLDNARELVPEDSDIDPRQLKFQGFDATEESEQFRYAQFLLNEAERWIESKIEDVNSHHANLPVYRLMVRRWKQSAKPHHLTGADVVRIVTDMHASRL